MSRPLTSAYVLSSSTSNPGMHVSASCADKDERPFLPHAYDWIPGASLKIAGEDMVIGAAIYQAMYTGKVVARRGV